MTNFHPFTISVPASTANLGPGFDSIGMAVDRYLTLHVSSHDSWMFQADSANLEGIPADKSNLIYTSAAWIADEYGRNLPEGAFVRMKSTIPLSRGFGSSASAIVAGIELADHLLCLRLSDDTKARWASLHEGHPDNVGPSVYGGLIIGSHRDDATDIVHAGVPDLELVAVIPAYQLSTKASRGTLPESMTRAEAVEASSVSNMLTAAILTGDWKLAGKMMKRDRFHRPHRINYIPEWIKAEETAEDLPIYGATLSGAGPVILYFVPTGQSTDVINALRGIFPEHEIAELHIDTEGVSVSPAETPLI